LKVDAYALPSAVVEGIKNGTVDLAGPATTVTLLKLNAVVGLKGTVETVNGKDQLTRAGITCALCHSTATKQYRTAPLKGVWQHRPYFHDGPAAPLEDVVQTYNTKQSLGLTPAQVSDLAQYLKFL
jgi:cytochrome c peroxidase